MKDSEYEKVYTVTDFYDIPRAGVADFNGMPHYYECPFDNTEGDWSNFFLLKPIDEETFQLAMEDWAIWVRWITALKKRETTEETHPVLSEDRARHTELKEILKSRLVVNEGQDLKARPEFWSGLEWHTGEHANPFARLFAKWRVIS
jgi:hypothetical protein